MKKNISLQKQIKDKLRKGDYDVYFVCPCGWGKRAPFGDSFHIHKEVCPECGMKKSKWKETVRRWIPTQIIVINGQWDIKKRRL